MKHAAAHMVALAGAALVAATGALAQAPAPDPRLFTHESYVEDVQRQAKLPIDDPPAMLAFVLGALPDRVKVYPTENYYYFKFVYAGVPYAGNIRLDVEDRDAGKVHFAYYQDLTQWKPDEPVTYVVLDKSQGVDVAKLDRFDYRITFRGKSVVFALNDLSAVKPPAGALGADETFIGPIFDDSAVRFLLVYDRKLKVFHYLLDETAPSSDEYFPLEAADRIVIGKRTGFAFYVDQRLKRKILIGVYLDNARLNTYFDGPFDQLPDNFIEGDTLRDIILDVDPSLRGKIDRLGNSASGEQRFSIAPYMAYETSDDLLLFDRCATNPQLPADLYEACFVVDPKAKDGGPVAIVRMNAGRQAR